MTNDQGDDLVDTALAQQQRLAVTEVAGGCFCCRFPDLLKGLETLQRTVEPDVILAEPVGSCTDLLATVVRPLRHYHAGRFRIAPLTILIDPLRNHSRFAAEVDSLPHSLPRQRWSSSPNRICRRRWQVARRRRRWCSVMVQRRFLRFRRQRGRASMPGWISS